MSLKFEHTEVLGWEHAIRGMRNPKNSWKRSDSKWGYVYPENADECILVDHFGDSELWVGPNDQDLMMRLSKGGPVHAKYRRMIAVYVDITAPLYWWKEFDTYKVGTVANSCSTMHKIAEKEFTLEDFSHEHLDDEFECVKNPCADPYEGDFKTSIGILLDTIEALNWWRNQYLHQKEINAGPERLKWCWWQMIQLLPSSYNQKRTIMLNYEVLAGIYPMRKNHKLDEWHQFCDWIEGLPYSKIITGMSESEKMTKIGEEIVKGIIEGTEHPNPAFIDKRNSILKQYHLSPEEVKETFDEVTEAMAKYYYAPIINDILNDARKSSEKKDKE